MRYVCHAICPAGRWDVYHIASLCKTNTATVGRGLAPAVRYCKSAENFFGYPCRARRPRRADENETVINGYSRYEIYCKTVAREISFFSDQWSVVSGQTDTENANIHGNRRGGHRPPVRYRKFEYNFSATLVGEGLAPPEENETEIDGYSQYIIYDNTVGEQKSSLRRI